MAQTDNNQASFIVGLWKQINSIVKENGFFSVLSTTLLMIIIMFGGWIALNPETVFKAFDRYEDKRHKESIQMRLLSTEVINGYLDDLRQETGARRVSLIELHNGRQNLANLSFNYGNLTYESLGDSVNSLAEELSEFSIDRFRFFSFLCDRGHWDGSWDELKEIDPAFAHKMAIGSSVRFFAVSLYGKGYVLGVMYIGFFEGDDYDPELCRKKIAHYAAQITPYLQPEFERE